MGNPRGFLELDRHLPERRAVPVRLKDWREVYEDFAPEELEAQASRCMDCGIPFCNQGCPLGNLIPDWNDLIYRNRWREAIEALHATNNFPEFTGRLCPAPCEAACVLGINADPVTIKQVEVEIIDRAWVEGWVRPVPPSRLTGRTVAVVGSGPAGLAAAQQLTRAGHSVTVYERADRIGGLLRYGIPEFKMEKRVLDRRLAQMRAEGTRLVPNTDIGVDISADACAASTQVLAGGATAWRDPPIPGREAEGVHQAMEYLTPANRVQQGDLAESPISAEGKHVVIIGGGDTGPTAWAPPTVRAPRCTSSRSWAGHPTSVPTSIPGRRGLTYKVTSAHEEGGERAYSVSTKEFLADDDGYLRALSYVEVEQRMVDGRPTFEEVRAGHPNRTARRPGLLAMGFTGPDDSPLLADLGVERDARSNVARGPSYDTNVENVYVCGDMGRGQSLIVWAIAEGRACAAAVDEALMGSSELPAPVSPNVTDRSKPHGAKP
ncbi:MAG: glutamate synthase subunit beta [Microthrixaceae bacterium]